MLSDDQTNAEEIRVIERANRRPDDRGHATLGEAGAEGVARILRHCLAAGLSDSQLVLPRSLIVGVVDATVAEIEALGLAVTEVEA